MLFAENTTAAATTNQLIFTEGKIAVMTELKTVVAHNRVDTLRIVFVVAFFLTSLVFAVIQNAFWTFDDITAAVATVWRDLHSFTRIGTIIFEPVFVFRADETWIIKMFRAERMSAFLVIMDPSAAEMYQTFAACLQTFMARYCVDALRVLSVDTVVHAGFVLTKINKSPFGRVTTAMATESSSFKLTRMATRMASLRTQFFTQGAIVAIYF